MAEIRTTKLSSGNQTVMLSRAHTRSKFKPDVEVAGGGETDRIVLASSTRKLDDVMKRARQGARRAGMRRSDVASAIAVVRSR